MKLKESVRQKLDNNRGIALVMLALDCSPNAARDYIRTNHDNLTKASALKMIREEFGLTDDQILEEDSHVSATEEQS